MAKITSKTKEKLDFLMNHFKSEDYKNYIDGKIGYRELCEKFECTDYIMSVFFKNSNLLKRRLLRKNNIRENIFDSINSSESAYIFGFYIADGCVTIGNKFLMTLNEQDLEILTKIRDFISPITKLLYKPKYTNDKTGITSNPLYCMSFTSPHIVEILNNYNCGKNKTYIEKTIKNLIPRNLMWDFIRGYFDGDGCVSSSIVEKKHLLKDGTLNVYTYTNVIFKITSKTRVILEDLQEFLISEGINILIYPDGRGCYTLGNHSLKDLKTIYSKLYTTSEFYMRRKKSKFEKIIGNTEITEDIKESFVS